MKPTDKRMTSERCAFLSFVAIAHKLEEAWICFFPVLPLMYISQYLPTIGKRFVGLLTFCVTRFLPNKIVMWHFWAFSCIFLHLLIFLFYQDSAYFGNVTFICLFEVIALHMTFLVKIPASINQVKSLKQGFLNYGFLHF